MLGASKFRAVGFEIEKANRGRDTWGKFLTMLKDENYENCTAFTRQLAFKRNIID